MDAILERIMEVAKNRGYKGSDICRAIDLDIRNYSAWKSGLSRSYTKYLPHIARFLGVDEEYLRSGTPLVAPDVVQDNFTYFGEVKKAPKIALLGNIACGEPILAVDNIEEMIFKPYGVDCDFALTCKGDSMIDARIYSGDIVYIKQQPDVEDGEIGAVRIGNDATLKKVYHNGDQVILYPCNPKYPNIVLTEDAQIIGKAVAFTSQVRC